MLRTAPASLELRPDTLTIQVFIPAGSGPPKTGDHLLESLGTSGGVLVSSVSGRQAEMQETRQLPFLTVMSLIKKPHAARLQAPSTDL